MRRGRQRREGIKRGTLVIMLTTFILVVSIVFILVFVHWGNSKDHTENGQPEEISLAPEPIPEDDAFYVSQTPDLQQEETDTAAGPEERYPADEQPEPEPALSEEPAAIEEPQPAAEESQPGAEELQPAAEEDLPAETKAEILPEKVDICLPGLHRSYTLAWVSDLHLISEEDLSRKGEDVRPGYKAELRIRRKTFSVTDDGICAEDVWPQIIEYLNSRYFDGIIFGGDMIDYCSHPNISLISEGYDQLKCRNQMYLRADHDYGAWYGEDVFTQDMADTLHHNLDGENRYDPKVMDFTGFRIVGVNYSNKDLLPDEAGKLIELEQCGKPVLVATHVPIASLQDSSLARLSMQVRNQIYYWDESQTSGNYVPNPYTGSFMESIYAADTPVHYVLAGHLHAKWEGQLTDSVPEHIFSPAFSGKVGIIRIHPDDWDPAYPNDNKRFQKNRLKDR